MDVKGDMFGLDSLPVVKKARVDGEAVSAPVVQAAPDVLSEDPLNQTSLVTRPTDTRMNVNIPYNDMTLPLQGPENPFGDRNRFLNQNALAGHVEEQAMTEHAFRSQYLTHHILGYSANPSVDPNAPPTLGSSETAQANNYATIGLLQASRSQKKELKRKRQQKGDLSIAEGEGAYRGPWASWSVDAPRNDAFEGAEADTEDVGEYVSTIRGSAQSPLRSRFSGVLHSQSMHSHLDWSYHGCFRHPDIPRNWSSAPEWLYGFKDQALGYIHTPTLPPHIPWPRKSCEGCDILE